MIICTGCWRLPAEKWLGDHVSFIAPKTGDGAILTDPDAGGPAGSDSVPIHSESANGYWEVNGGVLRARRYLPSRVLSAGTSRPGGGRREQRRNHDEQLQSGIFIATANSPYINPRPSPFGYGEETLGTSSMR